MTDEGADFDSWEDQADSGAFDKRLDEISVEIQQSAEKKKVLPQGHVMQEESSSTQYQPKLRILKRNTATSPAVDNGKTGSQSSGQTKSKSLQQREAEYAEARLRIFGNEAPEEDQDEGDGEPSRPPSISQIYKSDSEKPVPILRQPKGPDGTCGFNNTDHT